MTRIKVAVRVRPLSNRELETGSTSIIAVDNVNTIAITNKKVPEQNAGDSRERIRRFTFDYCLKEDSTQDHLFEIIEEVIGQSVKRRFNSCVLAYGQSASGKTHTMMGSPQDPGLTPKLCRRVFEYLKQMTAIDEDLRVMVSVSYLEIYNEKVKDLLQTADIEDTNVKQFNKRQQLKVREHPRRGPYVQGLTEHPVTNVVSLLECLDRGNKQRRVAATSINPQSSRSHSIFSISFDGVKLHLIDLAGSERASTRCYSTPQFREGININKSLVALGNVISALAEPLHKHTKIVPRKFVSYRDSVLTWLLKDTLGGNSNTVMVATVSPSSACYNETVNTLRFGQRAKLIVSHPLVIEDSKENTIRKLKVEIERLRELLKLSQLPLNLISEDNASEASAKSNEEQSQVRKSIQKCHNSLPSSERNETFDDLKKCIPCSCGYNTNNGTCIDLHKNNGQNCIPQESCVNIKMDSNYTHDDDNADGDNLKMSKYVTPALIFKRATETLLPLINVSSSLKPATPTKLKRTYSVDHTRYAKIDSKNLKMYPSDVSISLLRSISQTPSSSINFPKQSHKLGDKNNSSKTDYRKPLSTLLPKSILGNELPRKHSKKSEKDLIARIYNKNDNEKANSLSKNNSGSKSRIVAARTSRLHSKIEKKVDDIDTSDKKAYKNNLSKPKELNTSSCSTTKTHLRAQTDEDVTVDRHKHEETQTELLLPELCSQEIVTDDNNLRISFPEVKNMATEPDIIETKDVGIQCILFKANQVSEDKKTNSNFFTTTYETQLQELNKKGNRCPINKEENNLPPNLKHYSNRTGISINYLQEERDPIEIFCIVSPNSHIFSNNSNINILCNSNDESKFNENISDYSASQNNFLPTPDIIRNHDTFKQKNYDNSECPDVSKKNLGCIHFGKIEILEDSFTSVDGIIPENNIYPIANSSVVSNQTKNVTSINMLNVQVPEICLTTNLSYTSCMPLPAFKPELIKPEEYKYDTYPNKLEKADIHTSVVKHCLNCYEEIAVKCERQDPLDHTENNKKVQFSNNNQSANQRTLQAMSEFLNEATQLMKNVNAVAHNLSSCNNYYLPRDFNELSVILDDISEIRKFKIRNLKKQACRQRKHKTYSRSERKADSTQYEIDYMIPVNKYETLIEESCRRLEEKINRIPTQSKIDIGNDNTFYTHTNGLLDSFSELDNNPWDLSHLPNDNDVEDSSLESNPATFSDYGSLPRRSHKRHRIPTCSPSAFLRQLTNMRSQIIESSREELLGFSSNI